jgi:sugar phosphate permease
VLPAEDRRADACLGRHCCRYDAGAGALSAGERSPGMTFSQIRPTASRLHYAWVIVAVSFAAVVVTAGVRATPSVLIVPLEQEFHWSRATISFAIGVNLLLYGMVGPFAAAVMDRFGARRTTILALAATAAGVALTPAMREPWQFVLLWGVVVGVATGFLGGYFAAFIAARWFREREGLVVGLLTAANAAGQLVFLPSMAELASSAGWRIMSFVLAGTVIAFLPLLALLMRDRPEDLGIGRYGEEPRSRAVPPHAGNPVAVAFRALLDGARSRDFWLIAGGYFVCGATTNGLIGTHLIAACVDHGLSEVEGAGLLASTGVFALVGGTIAGWLSDRCDNRLLLFAYYGLRGLSLIYLPFAFGMPFYGLSAFSVVYGLDWIASAPPTVRLLSGVVGAERIGIMVAWITVIHQIGSASAAYLAGLLRIDFGTYLEAFLFSGILLLAAALMVLFIGVGRGRGEPEIAPAGAG